METALFSTMIRSGRTTYFIDVKEAKNGLKFLSITESRIDGEGKKQRSSMRVFADTAEQFRQAIGEAVQIATGR